MREPPSTPSGVSSGSSRSRAGSSSRARYGRGRSARPRWTWRSTAGLTRAIAPSATSWRSSSRAGSAPRSGRRRRGSSRGGPMPRMTVAAVGYGAGTRDLPGVPNMLRCFVGETTEGAPGDETILQVETTIDDMSPQLYEPLVERLFEAEALDVFLQPVVMKRGRPGVVVTALCAPDRIDDLTRVLFEETSTIGVRWSEWRRTRLQREVVTLATAYGAIPFKVSRLGARVVTVTPEFADVARIAREKALPVREVLDQARADGRRLLHD